MPQCRGCGASIFFAVTPKGNNMPLDVQVTTIVVEEAPLADGRRTVGRPIRGHQPHHISCPKRELFARKSPGVGASP